MFTCFEAEVLHLSRDMVFNISNRESYTSTVAVLVAQQWCLNKFMLISIAYFDY